VRRLRTAILHFTFTLLVLVGLFYGHTGHVRFLTSVDLGRSLTTQSSTPADAAAAGGGSAPRRHATFSGPPLAAAAAGGHPRYRPITPPPLASVTAAAPATGGGGGGGTLVVSGGDGLEDFRASSTDGETAGRDDSTNHLLLWRI